MLECHRSDRHAERTSFVCKSRSFCFSWSISYFNCSTSSLWSSFSRSRLICITADQWQANLKSNLTFKSQIFQEMHLNQLSKSQISNLHFSSNLKSFIGKSQIKSEIFNRHAIFVLHCFNSVTQIWDLRKNGDMGFEIWDLDNWFRLNVLCILTFTPVIFYAVCANAQAVSKVGYVLTVNHSVTGSAHLHCAAFEQEGFQLFVQSATCSRCALGQH